MNTNKAIAFHLAFPVVFLTVAFATEMPFSGSSAFMSPTGKSMIVVDFIETEGGRRPDKATLFSMPLSTDKGKPLRDISDEYIWSPDGRTFAAASFALTPKVVVYDWNGTKLDSLEFGFSPTFISPGQLLYYRENPDSEETPSAQIMRLDLKTKKIEIIYDFGSEFTFWTRSIAGDLEYSAALTQMWGGYRGKIHRRDSTDGDIFTFLVPWETTPGKGPWKGVRLLIWKGDVTDLPYPPKEKPFVEK